MQGAPKTQIEELLGLGTKSQGNMPPTPNNYHLFGTLGNTKPLFHGKYRLLLPGVGINP